MLGMMSGATSSMMGDPSSTMDATLTTAFREAVSQALVVATLAAVLTAVAASGFVTGRIVEPDPAVGIGEPRSPTATTPNACRSPRRRAWRPGDDLQRHGRCARGNRARRRDLIGDVAHELRTPIASARGLSRGAAGRRGRAGRADLGSAAWRGRPPAPTRRRPAGVVSAEARRIPLALQPTEPTRSSKRRWTALHRPSRTRIWPCTVSRLGSFRACRRLDRAVQVLSNLLTNALRYTPSPGDVHLAVRRSLARSSSACRDTGVGIAAEDTARVSNASTASTNREAGPGWIGNWADDRESARRGDGRPHLGRVAGSRAGCAFSFTLPRA